MANKVDFPTFCHELIILRGYNMGQIRTWQPVQNSAPIWRRLVEKLLKTVLFHQNDYQWTKNREVAFFIFRCDHFEGHMSHILRTAKKTRDLPLIPLSVVNCASAGTLPAEAESLWPLQGKLNKSGSWRITAAPLWGMHTIRYFCHHCAARYNPHRWVCKHKKPCFTPPSLGFCGASPTETEPSHCSFL